MLDPVVYASLIPRSTPPQLFVTYSMRHKAGEEPVNEASVCLCTPSFAGISIPSVLHCINKSVVVTVHF